MSFKVNLNSINLDCAPMVTEGFNGETNLIGYMCKKNNMRDIEGFEDVQNYDNNIKYYRGDKVKYNGNVYTLTDLIIDSRTTSIGQSPDTHGNSWIRDGQPQQDRQPRQNQQVQQYIPPKYDRQDRQDRPDNSVKDDGNRKRG